MPAFYYDPLIHPIAFYKTDKQGGKKITGIDLDDDDEFALPLGMQPFLSAAPLYTDNTSAVRSCASYCTLQKNGFCTLLMYHGESNG